MCAPSVLPDKPLISSADGPLHQPGVDISETPEEVPNQREETSLIADTWAKHDHPQENLMESRMPPHHAHTHFVSSFDWHKHWLVVASLVLSSVMVGVCLAACCKLYCQKYTSFRLLPCVKCRTPLFVEGVPQNEYHPLIKYAAPPPYSERAIP